MSRSGVKATDLSALREPTPRDRVQQRQGNRKHQGECEKRYGVCTKPHAILDYVTARFVMDRLDSIGSDNWQDRYEDRPDGSVRCGIGVLVDGEWVWKWDVGTESDIESDKGSYSDAFKRAGVKWGIARDLYPDDKHAQSAPGEASRPAAPRPATPPPPAGAAAPTTDGGEEFVDGAVVKGRAPVDMSLRTSPEGPVFGFAINEEIPGKQYPRKTQVVVHGALAEVMAKHWDNPATASVWGELEMVPWDKDGKPMNPYRRIHATRVQTPDWTLPAVGATPTENAAPGPSSADLSDLDNLPW